MSIKATCDACGSTFRVKAEYAGRRGKCPKCGAAILVPSSAEIEDSTPQIEVIGASAVPDQASEAIPIDKGVEEAEYAGEYDHRENEEDVYRLTEAQELPVGQTPDRGDSEEGGEYGLQTSELDPSVTGPRGREEKAPQPPVAAHFDVKGAFGSGTRYEIAASPFGSALLRVHRMRGGTPTGDPKEYNLALYEELDYMRNQGASFGENMMRIAVYIGIIVFGCGIVGVFLIFILGIPAPDWGGRPEAVLREKADGLGLKDPRFSFRNVSELDRFVDMIERSHSVSLNCID
jgi:hypothetical protein